jgi:hypothetical protein
MGGEVRVLLAQLFLLSLTRKLHTIATSRRLIFMVFDVSFAFIRLDFEEVRFALFAVFHLVCRVSRFLY